MAYGYDRALERWGKNIYGAMLLSAVAGMALLLICFGNYFAHAFWRH